MPKKFLYVAIIIIMMIVLASAALFAYDRIQRKEQLTKKGTDTTWDWKIYRNEKYGYELKYPPDWHISEEDEDIRSDAVIQKTYFDPNEEIEGYINLGSGVESRSLEEVKQSTLGIIDPIKIERISVDGIMSIRMEGRNTLAGGYDISILIPVVSQKTYYIRMSTDRVSNELAAKVKDVLQQMVASYKVTNRQPKAQ